jgi:hypothetical protein
MAWLPAEPGAVPLHEKAFRSRGSTEPFFPFPFQLMPAENRGEILIIEHGLLS